MSIQMKKLRNISPEKMAIRRKVKVSKGLGNLVDKFMKSDDKKNFDKRFKRSVKK